MGQVCVDPDPGATPCSTAVAPPRIGAMPAHTRNMSDSENIVRKRTTGEPGNPGQFGTTTKEHSGLDLDAPAQAPASVPPQEAYWILIDREWNANLAVGPYPGEAAANHAMQHALLIDYYCEEDCLDATVEQGEPPEGFERDVIDPGNHYDTGLGDPEA